MIIMPVNDRSTDGTREIIDRIAARRPISFAPSTARKASRARRPH
jgi:glycosyltransferase involved in cell wall biosynthesis